MTKQDYELIAETLKGVRQNFNSSMDEQHGVFAAIDELAIAFSRTNPRFDRDKFLTACGIEINAGFTRGDMQERYGFCGCEENESLIAGEHCDACGQLVTAQPKLNS